MTERGRPAVSRVAVALVLAFVVVLAGCSAGAGRTFAFTLTYAVQPSAGSAPTDQDVQTVAITIGARLSGTGLADYRVRTPGSGRITVEASPASALDSVRSLVGQPGHLAIVPLGTTPAMPGATVDLATHPALLGEREVNRATVNKDAAGSPLVALQLTQPAAQTLFTWSASHTGEALGIVMDGALVTVIMVAVPIEGGLLDVGGLEPLAAGQFAAVVNGGPLSFAILEQSAVASSPAP